MAKKKGDEGTQIKDEYEGLPPEHDGRPWQVPPPDWVAPEKGPGIPDLSGVPDEFFQQAIRAQLVASNSAKTETLWRTKAHEDVKPQFVAERAPHAAAFIDEMLQVVVDGDWPTLDECILPKPWQPIRH